MYAIKFTFELNDFQDISFESKSQFINFPNNLFEELKSIYLIPHCKKKRNFIKQNYFLFNRIIVKKL